MKLWINLRQQTNKNNLKLRASNLFRLKFDQQSNKPKVSVAIYEKVGQNFIEIKSVEKNWQRIIILAAYTELIFLKRKNKRSDVLGQMDKHCFDSKADNNLSRATSETTLEFQLVKWLTHFRIESKTSELYLNELRAVCFFATRLTMSRAPQILGW